MIRGREAIYLVLIDDSSMMITLQKNQLGASLWRLNLLKRKMLAKMLAKAHKSLDRLSTIQSSDSNFSQRLRDFRYEKLFRCAKFVSEYCSDCIVEYPTIFKNKFHVLSA